MATAIEATGRPTDDDNSSPRLVWPLRPVVFPAILTVVCLPLGTTVPEAGLDPSWRLAMSWAHLTGVHAGSDFVFTYGPLGFLSTPNLVWMPGLFMGVLYAVGTAFALSFMAYRWGRTWLRPPIAAAAVVLVAVAILTREDLHPVPEMATAAVLLWVLWLLRPECSRDVLASGWVALVGVVGALQLMVKFSNGVIVLAALAVLALARPKRGEHIAAGAVGAMGGFLVLWLAAGQSVGDIGRWLHLSLDVASGYSSAMAIQGVFGGGRYTVVLVVALVAIAWVVLSSLVSSGVRALGFSTIVVVGAWFAVKAGYVRLDRGHAPIAFLLLAALCLALPWDRALVGGVVFGWCILGMILSGVGFRVADLRISAHDVLVDHPAALLRAVRSVVQPSYRDEQLASARRRIRDSYEIPRPVIEALRGDAVHAEPWDIAALWAYGLEWQPELALQSYSTYTDYLDDQNRAHIAGRSGPSALLFRSDAIDGRVEAWESPGYQVEIVCRYRVSARGSGWSALQRSPNRCGDPVPLDRVTVAPGQVVDVPQPRDPESIVVATFEYERSLIDRLVTAVYKPSTLPRVRVNGRDHRLVTGTASRPHLVHVPQARGEDASVRAGLDFRRLTFPDASSPTVVSFFELRPAAG